MIQMDVLIVGSLAYDSLETPAGSVENELGGSASYGGFSAAFHNNKDCWKWCGNCWSYWARFPI